MPTGYTAKLAEGPQEFSDFLKHLARGMGFMILMRDEPFSAPLPVAFEPSDYNEKELAKHRARMDELNSLTAEQIAQKAHAAFVEDHARWLDYRQRKEAQADRYREMIGKLEAWSPTHHALKGMRSFGLEQLHQSLDFDCSGSTWEEPKEISADAWLENEIKETARQIEYHAAAQAKEVERTRDRNDALKAFHAELAKLSAD